MIKKEMLKIRHHAKIKAKDCESTEEDKSGNSRRSETLFKALRKSCRKEK